VPFDHEQAVELAAVRQSCPWCERVLRPCNLSRHIAAQHYRQLTIFDLLQYDPLEELKTA
jgi:hypothetical protein